MSVRSKVGRFFSGSWRALTWFRLALSNVLFVAVLLFLLFTLSGGAPGPLPDRAALVMDPEGAIVDQKTYREPVEVLLQGDSPASGEVLLRDFVEAIDRGAEDPAIQALVLKLDLLLQAGLSKIQEITPALERFRATGKPIVAIGDYYTQDQYLLASQADTVILHPAGAVALEGYASYRNYFREALEKLSVSMHVFRAGEHKSIAEPLVRNDMSEGEERITRRWLDELWGQYTQLVERRRALPEGAVTQFVNDYPEALAGHQGDPARLSLDAGLVDRLMTRDEARDYVVGIVGATADGNDFQQVDFRHYLTRKRALAVDAGTDGTIAVVTARGNIMMGEQPAGTIGGDSMARLLRETARRDDVSALVLRIDSGGGSVFASEVIRQAVLDITARGKPLVVSMGSVAASGGYYIAADADRIFAPPGTITGSIGVFAALPTFERLLARGGIHTDGVGTTDFAGALRLDRALDPALAETLQLSVDHIYRQFLQLVASGRDMAVAEVEPLAGGRVWSAPDALRHGLIDEIGGLREAVAAAAELAGVSEYETDYAEPPRSPIEQILFDLAERAGWSGAGGSDLGAALQVLLRPLQRAAAEIAELDDPRHLYVRCQACGMLR